MFKNKILGAIAQSLLGTAALAHNGATGVVMERMMGMSAIRDVLKDLAPMMQGQVPYDEWTVRDAATGLKSHAGDNMARLFPDELIPASSFAKPEIWGDWARFEALSEELRLYPEGLDRAAVNRLDVPAPSAAPASSSDEMAGMPSMDGATIPMEASPKTFTVEDLMGLVARADQSPATIAAPMADGKFTGIDFAGTAADDVFERISQTCASCIPCTERATDMRGLIRTTVAFGAMGFVGIAVMASWPIAEPVHLGMLAGDAYRGANRRGQVVASLATQMRRQAVLPFRVERR